jgi:hypothetical protein
LLRAVAGDGKRLWVVGDSRQSIYRFRGASSANMAVFSREYPGACVDQLSANYRSSQEIVDAVVAFTPRMGASQGMLPLTLTANRGLTASPRKSDGSTLSTRRPKGSRPASGSWNPAGHRYATRPCCVERTVG